jgi:hypothetical protein
LIADRLYRSPRTDAGGAIRIGGVVRRLRLQGVLRPGAGRYPPNAFAGDLRFAHGPLTPSGRRHRPHPALSYNPRTAALDEQPDFAA